MNGVAVLILAALLLEFLLELIADVLNLRALKDRPPEGFEDVFDPERYQKSQQYLRANTRFGWISGGFDLLVLLFFWFGGGFAWLDEWTRSLGGGEVWTGLVFVGILMAGRSLLHLPFGIYNTFVLEERFGFNRTTPKTFVMDRLKGMTLSVAIGGPLLAAILAFFAHFGPEAWLPCWLAVTGFSLLLQFVAPAWIMPLFLKFEPLEDGELRTAILDYADSADFPLTNVSVVDGSRRSAKSNAFFTGFGKNKRVALFDTLIERHTVPELVAVLAHEVGHYKRKHILQNMAIGIVQTGIMFFLFSRFISWPPLFEAFFIDTPSVHAGLVFFGMLFSPINFFLGIGMQLLSRKNEYEADEFAVQTTGDGSAMIEALKKLSAHNLSNLGPHPLYVFLHYSHPPIVERVRAIQERAKAG